MYYERTENGWQTVNEKSALFNGSTYPIEIVPPEFWNDNRKQASTVPAYNPDTEKLIGPQELGDGSVGYAVELLTPEETATARSLRMDAVVAEVQLMMDTEAQSRNYDNIFTACSYAPSSHPVFGPQGRACVAWRDSVWSACILILDDVEAGLIPEPSAQEVIDQLPVMVWP